jgi:hypothetical protein
MFKQSSYSRRRTRSGGIRRETTDGVLYCASVVDVPVPTKPPSEAILKSDRATRDQVTGLRSVGSRDDLSLTSLLCLPSRAVLEEDPSSDDAAQVCRSCI